MFATRKMKKTTMCARRVRWAFAFRIGRMRIIDAPVVPATDAISVPSASSAVFVRGPPRISPRTSIPPEIAYRPMMMTRNET